MLEIKKSVGTVEKPSEPNGKVEILDKALMILEKAGFPSEALSEVKEMLMKHCEESKDSKIEDSNESEDSAVSKDVTEDKKVSVSVGVIKPSGKDVLLSAVKDMLEKYK